MALKLDILANASDLIRNMKKAGDSVEDVSDALDDLAKDGGRDGDKLERTFKELSRAGSRAADDIGDDMRRGFRRAEQSAEKFSTRAKDELQDSAREGAASFSGELSDIPDVLQEATANLGPAGIAGGAIIGAIGAVALASVEEWNEKIDGIKQATADAWQAAAEEGQAFLDKDAVLAEAHRINWDKAYDEQRRAAEQAGVDAADLAIALATGEGEVFDRVHRQIMDARQEEIDKAREAMTASVDGNVAIQDSVTSVNSELARTVTVLDEKKKATEDAKERAQESADIEATLQQKTRGEVEKTRTKLQELYDTAKQPKALNWVIRVDDSQLRAAQQAAKQWADRGLNVAVTGTLAGKGVWE